MPGLDLIVPLGVGSKSDNDELRILLRSAERNAVGLGRVIVVTQNPPDWLRNAYIVPCDDPLPHNKDGNMINKVVKALLALRIRGDFVLTLDDTVFNMRLELERMPMLYNSRGVGDFTDGNNWHRRMRRTMELISSRGMPPSRNYETHTPQLFNGDKVLGGLRGVDYIAEPGYGIYSLFRCVSGDQPDIEQNTCKTTHENEDSAKAPMDRMFVGYNDRAFLNGLRLRLMQEFPSKSRFEK